MRAFFAHVDAYLVGIRFHFGGLWWQIQGIDWTALNHKPFDFADPVCDTDRTA